MILPSHTYATALDVRLIVNTFLLLNPAFWKLVSWYRVASNDQKSCYLNHLCPIDFLNFDISLQSNESFATEIIKIVQTYRRKISTYLFVRERNLEICMKYEGLQDSSSGLRTLLYLTNASISFPRLSYTPIYSNERKLYSLHSLQDDKPFIQSLFTFLKLTKVFPA